MLNPVILVALATEHRSASHREHRTYDVRFAADEDAGTFTGLASVFHETDSFGDIVRPGAFTRTLDEHRQRGTRPPMLWSHDPSQVVGVWTDLRETERGLEVQGRLVTETARGKEAHALLKAGALSGLSIGFRTRQAERVGGKRHVSDIDLVEISLVAMPAASNARIHQVRSGHASAVADFVAACRHATRSFNTKRT